MTWNREVKAIEERRQLAEGLGGAEAVNRQHEAGRLTARERIGLLVDEESWRELGTMTGTANYDENGQLVTVRPANTIVGTGRINGRRVAVEADDYTIRGGSTEATISEKWEFINRYAL
ncbi:MAG: carboxyl transferase domain-containing protein, partial [Acidimicrobiales bacterium]|nr:carboxyl transferase domain-containing protein [Acidimicrobiales bacterium]